VAFLTRAFKNPAIPQEYRANFTHLFLDIAWFGVLSGSSLNFLNVYAARLGATGVQIGLLTAVAAAVNLALAIPAGRWIEKRPLGRTMFWTSVIYRAGFLLWIPLPWLFGSEGQIWALIGLTALMAIPLTALGVGFNVLFAATVPPEWRAYVMGGRNVLLSLTFMGSSLVCGYLLNRLPFPGGYQVVFLIGFIGAAMSSLHLYFLKPVPEPAADASRLARAVDPLGGQTRPSVPAKSVVPTRVTSALRLDIWRSPFRRVLLVMLGFHLAQFLAIPLFPLYFVNELKLNDQEIGVGTALFYLAVLLGSTQLRRIVHRLGHKTVTGVGAIAMGTYPFFLGLSTQVWQYYAVSFVGGFGWSLVGGAYANYMLESIPANDRPVHFAWYAIVLNACILTGSILGPLIAQNASLSTALLVFGLLRALAGLAILKFG
jgi:MFS family permease